jgi:hypothetical protein
MELRLLEGKRMAVKKPREHFEEPTISLVNKGDHVQFTTAHMEVSGVVLDIDHGAVYPIRVEYHTASGDKRIVSFSPNEFTTFKLKGTKS